MNDTPMGWVLAGIGTVIATLAGAVASLWKLSEAKNAKAIAAHQETIDHLETRAEKCEHDREELRVRVARLETKYEDRTNDN